MQRLLCVLSAFLVVSCGIGSGSGYAPGVAHSPVRFKTSDGLIVSARYVEDATVVIFQGQSDSPELVSGDFASARRMLRNGGNLLGNRPMRQATQAVSEKAADALPERADWCPEGTAFSLNVRTSGSESLKGERLQSQLANKAAMAFLGRCLPDSTQ